MVEGVLQVNPKIKFNKKGTAASEMWAPDTILFWLFYGIVLGFAAVFFVLIVSKSGSDQVIINGNLESLNLMQRFFISPSCFIYNKDGIVLNRVIDTDKFNEARLNSCYNINEKLYPAFKITLNSQIANFYSTIKTKNWNDNREFEEKKAPKNILLYSQNKLHNGEIIIETQNIR